jgi:hypothetical protein
MSVGVGSTVWYFDENRRVYLKGGDGRSCGGPIWREHWRPVAIVSENSVSWIGQCGEKINKKLLAAGALTEWASSQEEIDERQWVAEHRYKIVRALEQERRPDLIRQVAEVLGWKPA